MMEVHHCTQRCSHRVTDEELTNLGFPVSAYDKVCGQKVLVRPGMERGAAIYAAWCAGLIRICTREQP